MSLLPRLPRWLRVLLLGLNLAASVGVLAAYWFGTYGNLIASWFGASAFAAVAVPLGRWATRHLDARQAHLAEHVAKTAAEHTARHLADQHAATRAHVTDSVAVLADQIAAVHVRLDALSSPTSTEGDA